MEASKISRLHEEQQKAVSETEEKIGQFEKYKADYKALQKRLETLPDKVTHDVMVPFGKLAFMPGQLVHTNEILVLLGDNWFAERSAKQACDIASRRITELDKRIAELKEQKSLLEPRLEMTSELQAAVEGKGDYREIIEEFDEEKEKLWDEQHKINVRRHREKMRNSKNSSNTKDEEVKKATSEGVTQLSSKSDDDFWSRLDALEKQEEERGELNSSFESDNDDDDDDGRCSRKREISPGREKGVKWMDEERSNPDAESDDKEDGGDEDDDESDDNSKPVIKTITFQHTKTSQLQHHHQSEEPTTSTGDATTKVTSPADIYKLFSPKPILKKSSEPISKSQSVKFPDRTGDHYHLSDGVRDGRAETKTNFAKPADSSREKAFTGFVKEKPTCQKAPLPTTTTSQEKPKRVSKFKAQRMGQNPG